MTEKECFRDKQCQEKWKDSIKKFHEARTIQVSRLPSNIEESNIRECFSFFNIKNIEINQISQTAKILLYEPETFDPLLCDHEIPTTLKGHNINVKYSTKDNFLCVSNLPITFTDFQFKELANKFGPVDDCFLIYDDDTDDSKGYGLVQYCSRAVACQARNLLHRKVIETGILHCDWLDHKILKYTDLYSKCIYVDNLPLNYCNLGNFRKIFSCVVNPLYCQLAFINGRAAGFGLIEYNTSEEAKVTCFKLKNCELESNVLRICLAIPSVPAIKLHDKFIADINMKKICKPLLSTPVFPSIFPQLQPQMYQVYNQINLPRNYANQNNLISLYALNPVFLQNPMITSMKNWHIPNKSVQSYIKSQNVISQKSNVFNKYNIINNDPDKLSYLSSYNNQQNIWNNDLNRDANKTKNLFQFGKTTLNPFMQTNNNNFFKENSPVVSPVNCLYNYKQLADLLNTKESCTPYQKLFYSPTLPASNVLTPITNHILEKSESERKQEGLKRKLKLLPSPEPSPENNYVGQHSQGIGGHYAESYFRKKLKLSK